MVCRHLHQDVVVSRSKHRLFLCWICLCSSLVWVTHIQQHVLIHPFVDCFFPHDNAYEYTPRCLFFFFFFLVLVVVVCLLCLSIISWTHHSNIHRNCPTKQSTPFSSSGRRNHLLQTPHTPITITHIAVELVAIWGRVTWWQ